MPRWYLRELGLFRGDDKGVVGLATVGHLDRNAGAGRAEALRGVLHPSLVDVRAAVQREDLGIRQPFRRIAENGLLVLAVRDDPAVEQCHSLALLYSLTVDGPIAHGARPLPALRTFSDLAHALRRSGEILRRYEWEHRGHARRALPP